MNKKILIIGAGPCGLGAAYRLKELGYRDWKIVEKNPYVGGLSASFKDDLGFSWDIGGHVLFSSHDYFAKLMDIVLGSDYIEHERKAFVKLTDRWVAYPFQNNIHNLAPSKALECLFGLLLSRFNKRTHANFKEWIVSVFGKVIAGYFMLPYNSKVWVFPLDEMSYEWTSGRVSVVSLRRVLRNFIFAKDDSSWGENNKFRFPLFGGTGEIFRRLALNFDENLRLGKEAVSIDVDKREVVFNDGTREGYDNLINTMPIDIFANRAGLDALFPEINKLKHNSVYSIGLGLKRRISCDKCWVYFPSNKCPFYRLTYFSNYSSRNAPQGDYSSLLCETAFFGGAAKNKEVVIDETIQALIDNGILRQDDRDLIVSRFLVEAEYAYPIPTLGRDRALSKLQPYLEDKGVYSRGRFGSWLYEKGNMDHSLMQGVEAVDRILNR